MLHATVHRFLRGGTYMAHLSNIGQQVMEIIVHQPGTTLDDIVLECPDLTWNQVFIAIDRMSREGTINLTPKGRGVYTVQFSHNTQSDTHH